MNHIIQPEPAFLNLSPVTFRYTSLDFFKCYLDFKMERRFSVVPYFLLGRCIELYLKSIHLEKKRQKEVKDDYGHNLIESYEDLESEYKILSDEEKKLLKDFNDIYAAKHFEYIKVSDPCTKYSRFPDINDIEKLARKICEYDKHRRLQFRNKWVKPILKFRLKMKRTYIKYSQLIHK